MVKECIDCGKSISRETGHSNRCSHHQYLFRKSYFEKYRKSERRKLSVNNYNATHAARENKRKYNKTPKGIFSVHKYHRTEKGQESRKNQVFKRRARLKEITFDLPKGWKKKIALEYPSCVYCGSTEELQVDHLYPLLGGVGGENTIENFVMACRKCNQSKGNKILEKWFEDHPEKKRFFYSNPLNQKSVKYLEYFYSRKVFI